MKKNIIYVCIIIALIVVLCVCLWFAVGGGKSENKANSDNEVSKEISEPAGQGGSERSQSESVEKVGAQEFSSDVEESDKEYVSSDVDENAVLIKDGASVKITNSSVDKASGDASNTENSEFYGVNAGILVEENSSAYLDNLEINTSAKGSNAVFSTGTDSKVYISNSTISTSSNSSRGLDSTYGGYIAADNVTISTKGISCATLATDRGEGTVIVKNSKLSTAGQGSPVIYSTGNISINDTEGVATGAQMVVIEGKNTATVTDSVLECSGKGNRNDVDNCGIMIYQSMSGDAGQGTGTFNAKGSSLSISSDSSLYDSAPFFFITNTSAAINLEDCDLNYGSGVLIKAVGTDEWGKSGNNGGDLTLNAVNQELVGDVVADSISSVFLNLKDGSSLKGSVNSDDSAKELSVSLDSSSTWVLTGDCYLTSLDDEDSSYSNIDFNGFTLYVNGVAVNG